MMSTNLETSRKVLRLNSEHINTDSKVKHRNDILIKGRFRGVTKVMLKRKSQFMCFMNCLFYIKSSLLLPFIIVFVIGCNQNYFPRGNGFALQAGDLLFQDADCGPLCDSIEEVTGGYLGARFSHVGIVAQDANNDFVVIEALSSGVKASPLESFLGRSLDKSCRPKVVVGRLKPAFSHLIPLALKEAFALRGKPYDKLFVINNDSYYCSELIYEIFLRANDNKPVFTLEPMTFKKPDTGATLATWQEYFSKLGVSIPESEPGINPGGISRSEALSIIYSYGIPDGWEKRYPDL